MKPLRCSYIGWFNMASEHEWGIDLTSVRSQVSLQQSVTGECIWLKNEIIHLPGGVEDTSGLGDVFGFEVTRWGTLWAERENSDHESFCFSISQACLTCKMWQIVSLTTDEKKEVLNWEWDGKINLKL